MIFSDLVSYNIQMKILDQFLEKKNHHNQRYINIFVISVIEEGCNELRDVDSICNLKQQGS